MVGGEREGSRVAGPRGNGDGDAPAHRLGHELDRGRPRTGEILLGDVSRDATSRQAATVEPDLPGGVLAKPDG